MATRAARGGEYFYATDVIEYTFLHKEIPVSTTNTERSCTDFLSFSIDDSDRFRIPCSLLSKGNYYQAQQRQFKARLSHHHPELSRTCLARVTESFMEIVRIANATHSCVECQPDVSSTVRHFVNVGIFPMERDGPLRFPATRASVVELLSRASPSKPRDEDCSVCMEAMKLGKTVTMPCSHSFHQACLLPWLDHNHVCPLCRYKLPRAEYRSLE